MNKGSTDRHRSAKDRSDFVQDFQIFLGSDPALDFQNFVGHRPDRSVPSFKILFVLVRFGPRSSNFALFWSGPVLNFQNFGPGPVGFGP